MFSESAAVSIIPPAFFGSGGREPTVEELRYEMWKLHMLRRRGGIYSRTFIELAMREVRRLMSERAASRPGH